MYNKNKERFSELGLGNKKATVYINRIFARVLNIKQWNSNIPTKFYL